MPSDIDGPGGGATMPTGFTIHSSGWSATLNFTAVETTGFAEVGNRTFDATAVNLVGSLVGTGQTSNTLNPGASLGSTPAFSNQKGTITLMATTGCTWSFTGLITSTGLGRVHDGTLEVGYNFVSSGPITQTWT